MNGGHGGQGGLILVAEFNEQRLCIRMLKNRSYIK